LEQIEKIEKPEESKEQMSTLVHKFFDQIIAEDEEPVERPMLQR